MIELTLVTSIGSAAQAYAKGETLTIAYYNLASKIDMNVIPNRWIIRVKSESYPMYGMFVGKVKELLGIELLNKVSEDD